MIPERALNLGSGHWSLSDRYSYTDKSGYSLVHFLGSALLKDKQELYKPFPEYEDADARFEVYPFT